MVNESALLQELIRKKRDRDALSDQEIRQFVEAVANDLASEGQIGAFTMAVLLNGMSYEESAGLTLAMRDSGEVISWEALNLDGPVVDKHSTGGVGDCVSLMLAPMLAACGAFVPMISGRGLGHTGGTLDKLASIPGYDIRPSIERFQQVVARVGCAIIGQTSSLAPADGRIYSVRDVTATVESIPLITASILSKKLAAGLDCLVMDIKVGNGAFMTALDEARGLAASIHEVARRAGLKSCTLITDMNQPLASAAGNALEIAESARYLAGEFRDARLHEVVVGLGAALLVASGIETEKDRARDRLQAVLDNGQAQMRFDQMIQALGGPSDFSSNALKHLVRAPVIVGHVARQDGWVTQINTRDLGLAVVGLGGGRRRPDDKIDFSVGFDEIVRVGVPVSKGDVLCRIHAASDEDARRAIDSLEGVFVIGPAAVGEGLMILEEVS